MATKPQQQRVTPLEPCSSVLEMISGPIQLRLRRGGLFLRLRLKVSERGRKVATIDRRLMKVRRSVVTLRTGLDNEGHVAVVTYFWYLIDCTTPSAARLSSSIFTHNHGRACATCEKHMQVSPCDIRLDICMPET
jgi:hypothetical protein